MKVAIIVPPALKTNSLPAEIMLGGVLLDRLNRNMDFKLFDLNSEYRFNRELSGELKEKLSLFLNANKNFENELLGHLQGSESRVISLLVSDLLGSIDFSGYGLITVAALEREHVKLGLCFAKYLKSKTGKPLIFGSICDTLAYDAYRNRHLIGYFSFIDYLIDKTRGYDILLKLLNNYSKGNFSGIAGLVYRAGGKIIHVRGYERPDKASFSYNMDMLEPPMNISEGTINNCSYLYYDLGRGCRNNCFFCNVNYLPCTMKSPKKAVEDIKQLVDRYGIKNFILSCSSINRDKDWLHAFLDEILKRRLEFHWITMAIPANLDAPLLKKMADCGCVNLHFGFESRHERRINALDKGIKRNETEAILKDCNKAGICARVLFMVGFPHETEEEIKMIEGFIRKNHQLFASIDIQTFKLKSDSLLFLDKTEMKHMGLTPREPEVFGFNYVPYDEVGGLSWEEKIKDNLKKREHLLGVCRQLGIERSSVEGVNKRRKNLFRRKPDKKRNQNRETAV